MMLNNLILKAMVIKGQHDVKDMLSNTTQARAVNEKLLFKILNASKNCEYGLKYHFSEIKTVEEYKKALPITQYSDYAESIQRIINENKQNVLTSLPVIGFAKSSGSLGQPKAIPLTDAEVSLYVKYTKNPNLHRGPENGPFKLA